MQAATNADDARRTGFSSPKTRKPTSCLRHARRELRARVHSGFNEQRQPLLRGDARDYVIARADRVAFVAKVVRFGFSRADFALASSRFRGKRSTHSLAATFAMTVENVHTGRCATYRGGPGRAWTPELLLDLIKGTLVWSLSIRTQASTELQTPCPIHV